MKIIGIIPARFKSSRFPGKPLAEIQGKPMIWWVYQQALQVSDFHSVFVATDDEQIRQVCHDLQMQVIMTSDQHPTGTDRIGEVARNIQADLYVNIQGDEPLIEPEVIREAIKPFYNNPQLLVSNLMTRITDPVDLINFTVPKVIASETGLGVYLTRSAAPYPKGEIEYSFYKQVCVYGFKPEALEFFCKTPRGRIEKIEDIEILRFIENGIQVKYIEVDSSTVAVDTPNDLKKVNEIVASRIKDKGL